MTPINELLRRFDSAKERTALVTANTEVTYAELLTKVENDLVLRKYGCEGTVVLLIGDYTATAIACLLALWRLGNVVALYSTLDDALVNERAKLVEATRIIKIGKNEKIDILQTDIKTTHSILRQLNHRKEPGFVIFSSGSTGQQKASVHSAYSMLNKHLLQKKCLTSISFLLFDHIGGLNTLFYVLFNTGKLVIPASRSPDIVAQAIEKQCVEALTTSPTFLNLLVIDNALTRYDFSSLKVINYGTEPMPTSLLAILNKRLPWVRFSQAYGLTETGVIPVRSISSTSTWITFDRQQCDVRIVDGLLEVKVKTSMLGYINAPSPFTADGYLKTADIVQKEGDHYRVLGRQSDLINVGGEKVYPSEIENVLRDMPGVVEVAVTGVDNPIMGKIVGAAFKLQKTEQLISFRRRLYEFCYQKMPASHIPRKIFLTDAFLHTARSKKLGTNTLCSMLNKEYQIP